MGKNHGRGGGAGGAVLTKEYAESIGADCYCKDAMASVNFAEAVICLEGKGKENEREC